MNDTQTDQLPIFPASAPDIFADAAATKALFGPVMAHLETMVEVSERQLANPTPCAEYNVSELRRHVLGWLQFFTAALNDPAGAEERLDTETWDLQPDQAPADLVRQAAADFKQAIDAGVSNELVVMSQARMAGDCVLAMALGEYAVHGWDLAVATGRQWSVAAEAAAPALAFLQGTVAPEYRHPDAGMFGPEISAPADASAFEQLLCFVGRNPAWTMT